jgi:hypothetical protein
MSRMRRPQILGLVGLVVLLIPVVLAAFLKGGGHRAPSTSATAPAVVFARQDGNDGLALAVDRTAVRVMVFDSQGQGVNGRQVSVAGVPASSCGRGCYSAQTQARGNVPVVVDGRRFTFAVPRTAPDATSLMQRATSAFRKLRSVTFVERLASSTRDHIVSTFTLEAPNRLEYQIHGGAAGIVIGTRRWDRTNGKWTESPSTLLPQPSPVWGTAIADAHVVERLPGTVVVSFVNPNVPAWFEVHFDARTLLPQRVDMIAAAHFMHHRYTAFNAPRRIFPPR